MAFLTGRVQFVRFKVKGRAHKTFGVEQLERLTSRAIGQARVISSDGVDVAGPPAITCSTFALT